MIRNRVSLLSLIALIAAHLRDVATGQTTAPRNRELFQAPVSLPRI